MRLVYLIRHPVERARSEYIHHRALGHERRPLAEALLEEPAYLDKGRYALHIDRYLEHFPPEQLVVILSEDLLNDRADTMARICGFLGIEAQTDGGVLAEEFHRSEDKQALSAVGALARRVPGYRWVGARSPALLRRTFRTVSRRGPSPAELVIPDLVRRELVERLRPDLDRLTELVPGAPARWGL